LPLLSYLRQARPWAVLVHRPRLLRPLQLARSLAGVPCRIAAVIHNHLGAQLQEGAGDPGRRRRSFELLRRCDALIAVSAETARDAAEQLGLPPAAVRIAYPPVDPEALRVLASAEGGAPRPARYLVGVGRLEAEKDFPSLLRAFALVARQRAELDLVILGEGRERPLLEGLVAELALTGRVRLPGFLSNPYPWIAGAQLLALSSRWEGFGIVLAEALALGVPVVATDCPGGPREILAQGRYGTLVAPGDVQALAAAILATLAEPPDRARLRQGAERFSPAAGLRAYLNALGLTGPAELA
jgi:glycosyltransferase involved in cell wall biosynthesis